LAAGLRPQVFTKGGDVEFTPLAIVANPRRATDRAGALGVIDNPLGDVPALAAEELDHLAGREPVDNTAHKGRAAIAAWKLGSHRDRTLAESGDPACAASWRHSPEPSPR
jgi:hypothetical protein